MTGPESVGWHALSVEEVFRRLATTPDGLTSAEAEDRLLEHGPNQVDVRSPVSAWRLLWHQLASVVVGLLVAAALLALVLGDALESAAIGAVLLINVVVGFWTEWRARVAVESLRTLQVDQATVLRDGRPGRIDARAVVPGDVLVLGEGDAVAADGRLFEAHELRLNEAALTGESLPVTKGVEALPDPAVGGAGPGDRRSMVYKSTTVSGGAGRALVTATGRRTEIGRIGELVGSLEQAPTPIERRLSELGRRLVWITLGIAGLVISVGFWGGRDVWLVIETGLALAIAAVPEGLPVVATVTLAVGMWRMAGRNALVRRPAAVEALGSATVICADKTGTLTTGRMTVTTLVLGDERIEVSGAGLDLEGGFTVEGRPVSPSDVPGVVEMARIGVLANAASMHRTDDGWATVGDPTDVALLVLGSKVGVRRDDLIERAPEIAQLPFSSLRMLMAGFHEEADGGVTVFAKGAADRILERCSTVMGPEGTQPLASALKDGVQRRNDALAAEGLRVLAFARGTCSREQAGTDEGVRDLALVGLAGMMDPPAPGVRETLARFHAAGVRTVMITGDHAATARSVAMRLGMLGSSDPILSGRDVAEMSAEDLREAVAATAVYGRVSPEDKLRIVEALQARGEVVGMLGDGVNDAPALLKADIGVAMGGRGTDVAKDVADLVLADDRLETVGVAIEEGRVIFDNIRKFIFYLFSCNVSEVGVVFLASLVGLPLPLLPLQLLWLNVVTDVFPALALAVEPGEPDVMSRPPRPPQAEILSRGFLTHLMVYGSLITVATLGVFVWGLRFRGLGVEHAVTLAFMALAMAQLLHVFNARSFGPLRLDAGLLRNPWLWAALGLSVTLQILSVESSWLSLVLDTRPLHALDWTVVALAAVFPLVSGQAWKGILARRAGPVAVAASA